MQDDIPGRPEAIKAPPGLPTAARTEARASLESLRRGFHREPRTAKVRSSAPLTAPVDSPRRRWTRTTVSGSSSNGQGAGLSPEACPHTFRAAGISAYLGNGGTIEKAPQIAAHESPKPTTLYDRTTATLSLDEIERIAIWDDLKLVVLRSGGELRDVAGRTPA